MSGKKLALLIEATGADHETFSLISRALLSEMRKASQEVILVRSRRSPAMPFRTRLHGATCYSIGDTESVGHQIIAALQLAWIFLREKVDLAHIHCSGRDHWGFALYRLFFSTPYVLTLHFFSPSNLKNYRNWRAHAHHFLVRNASRVTTVSESLAQSLCASYPQARKKLRVVGNGVGNFQGTSSLDRPLPGNFVLTVGSLYFEKGTDVLLFALHDLMRRGRRDVRLILCGQDMTNGLMNDLSRRLEIEPQVQYWGPCPHDAALELMRKCLFFVCPSRFETFGIAILEAMAQGKAVIAPRAGGVPEHVSHEQNGLLFEPGNAADLADSIERLMDDPLLRSRLSQKARLAARAHTWPKVAKAYEEVQAEALARQ